MTDLSPQDWTAYNLSHEAGVQSPDTRESPGALFLLAVRDAAVSYYESNLEAVYNPGGVTGPETLVHGLPDTDDDWWHDQVHHLADEAVPLPTHQRWQVFTDLCLWQDDDLAIVGDRDHLGAKISLTDQATGILYEVAHRLTWTILTELTNEAEESALAELNATPGDAEAEAEAREGTGL